MTPLFFCTLVLMAIGAILGGAIFGTWPGVIGCAAAGFGAMVAAVVLLWGDDA